MMVSSAPLAATPSTSLFSYSIPTNLLPNTKVAVEKRLVKGAEKVVPNAKYPQLEERVSLVKTLGYQPLSFREIALATLAATVFSISWGLTQKTQLSFLKPDTNNPMPLDVRLNSLIRLEKKDTLGINKPLFYYATTEKGGNNAEETYWKQWEEPSSEASMHTVYRRTEQEKPFNARKINETGYLAENHPKEGGLCQTYSGQALYSEWCDEYGVNWTANHAINTLTGERTKAEMPEIENTGGHQILRTEVAHLTPEILTMHWTDKNNKALAHSIRISYTEGIEYQQYSNGKMLNNAIKKLTIDEIGEGKFETLLRGIDHLPTCLQNAHQFVNKITTPFYLKESDQDIVPQQTRDYCEIIGPEKLETLRDYWWRLHESNQPLKLNVKETLIQKAQPFILPSIIGVLGAGAGLIAFHWWKERKRNQSVLDALAKANSPETITYAQAKKYNLLG
jgi:hypothetical protein